MKKAKIKKIIFLTGTRADFSKLKPLINKVENSNLFECYIFITGMHALPKYGFTFREVYKEGYKNIFVYTNQTNTTDMDIILSNTIVGFSSFVNEIKPDMIVIHGDRVEPLAGAIVGSMNNILVAHVEGGEVSGNIDESIRHAVSKLSHIHFVAHEEAKRRLIRMGELKNSIFIIGSPDIDIMKLDKLPTIQVVKKRYEIPFNKYAIFIFHPVTTILETLEGDIKEILSALVESNKNYVVIYPNNDKGTDIILKEYKRFNNKKSFRVLPSMRLEFFLALLKNAGFIIGNSSVGIREAEIYNIPAINIGIRQKNRTKNKDIININPRKEDIFKAIQITEGLKIRRGEIKAIGSFGKGDSAENFYKIIKDGRIWSTKIQK